MSFTEKVDVLDLLINILKEHEDKLDKLVARMETFCSNCPLIKDEAEEDDRLDAQDARPVC